MMRKKIVSLCMALALCLGLLPATALAADGDTVYVGGVTLSSSTDSPAYATTDDSGNVSTASATADNYNIKWDGNTLTLKGAYITKEVSTPGLSSPVEGAAIGVYNQSGDANLTITLEGTNTIKDVSAAIHVFAPSGSASLTITGDGILSASSGYNPGIRVQSNTGNGTLAITGAKVTASSSYSGNGVQIRCGDSSNASLTVNGGSLTATGSGATFAGIIMQFGSSTSGSGTPTVTVSDNAIVRANGSAGGITSNSSTGVQYGTGSNSTGGIVWNGSNGTVYGSVTLQENITISEGESLTIPEGSSLDMGGNEITVASGGKLEGTPTGSGTVKIAPTITTESLPEGTVGTAYNQLLGATGSETITWSLASGTLPTGLKLSDDGKITGTPATEGSSTFTVKAENSAGSATQEYTLKINPTPTVSVTGVKLNQSELSLFTGGSATLTATVQPSNATNQNVTWQSDNANVATVEGGTVTAVGAGEATITVTTQDGNHTAACTVTVSSYLPPANPNYRITLEATQGGTVTADPTAAKAGTTVTLTPVPDRGYQVGTVAVTDRFGETVEVTENADGTYTFTMPSGQVTVTVTFEQAPLPFPDVAEGDWFYDAVRYAYENSLMDGVGDNLFAPNSETTRAQLVTILHRLEGEPEVSGTSGFTDVEAGHLVHRRGGLGRGKRHCQRHHRHHLRPRRGHHPGTAGGHPVPLRGPSGLRRQPAGRPVGLWGR